MQKYVIALYIRLSIEDYKYDSLSIENQSLVLHEYAASMPETMNAEITGSSTTGTAVRTSSVRRYRGSLSWCGPIRSTASSSGLFPLWAQQH